MSTVTFNGTRLNDAETAGGWSNRTGGGPAPAAEPQLKYQGSNAVNRKVNNTTARQGIEYTHGSTFDMTGTNFPLWFAKVKVGDASDVNATYGVEVTLGSGSAARHEYNISGSGANNDQYTAGYNSQGGLAEGYIITAVNPNIAQWREATSGSPVLTAVDYFAMAAQFVTGGAKSENVACDAIDLGLGLDYNGSAFTFEDGVSADQGVVNNRWGCACRNGSVLALRGLHRIGTTSATSGTDESTVLFPDGYHGTGDCGIEIDTTRSTVSLNGRYTGLGRVYGADDTRPNLTFIGDEINTSTHSGEFGNHNAVTLQSVITLSGAVVECSDLTQAGAALNGGTRIGCDAAAGVAVCNDADFTLMDGVEFIQVGSGHAIEITATGTYNFTNLDFTGFGADGTNAAAIYNSSGGSVTINVAGGDSPSVRNGSGASTTVQNVRTYELTNLVPGSEVLVIEDTGNPATATVYGSVESSGPTFSFTYNYISDVNVRVVIHSLAQEYLEFADTLTGSDKSVPVQQRFDRNYKNP